MDSSGDSEANDSESSQEKKLFRIAKDADLRSRNYDNLRTPDGWQDHLICEMFKMAVSEVENTAAAIGKEKTLLLLLRQIGACVKSLSQGFESALRKIEKAFFSKATRFFLKVLSRP